MKTALLRVMVAMFTFSGALGLILQLEFHDQAHALWSYTLFGFTGGAIILGRWALGYIRYTAEFDGKRFAEPGAPFLWFACIIACSFGFIISWLVALAAFLGMLTGWIIWSSPAHQHDEPSGTNNDLDNYTDSSETADITFDERAGL